LILLLNFEIIPTRSPQTVKGIKSSPFGEDIGGAKGTEDINIIFTYALAG